MEQEGTGRGDNGKPSGRVWALERGTTGQRSPRCLGGCGGGTGLGPRETGPLNHTRLCPAPGWQSTLEIPPSPCSPRPIQLPLSQARLIPRPGTAPAAPRAGPAPDRPARAAPPPPSSAGIQHFLFPRKSPAPGREAPPGPAPPLPGLPVPRDLPRPHRVGSGPSETGAPQHPPRRMEMGNISPSRETTRQYQQDPHTGVKLLASSTQNNPHLCRNEVAIPGEERFGVLLPNLHKTRGMSYHCLHPAGLSGRSRRARGSPLHNSLSSNTSPPASPAELRCRDRQLSRDH